VLQKCAKNAQVQNNPNLKWGTCHTNKYVVTSKIIVTLNLEDQNNTLIKTRISYGLFISLPEGDGIPLALLYRVHATSMSWVYYHVKTPHLASVASTSSATNTSPVVFQTLKSKKKKKKKILQINFKK